MGRRAAISIVIVQISWFVVIMSAAAGREWIGILTVAAGVVAHAYILPNFRPEIRFLAAAVAVGLIFDSTLGLTGILSYPGSAGAWMSRPFMIALWVNFALVFPLGLAWLADRPFLGAVFGALGGAGAYYGGARLGAVEMATSPAAVAAVALGWAVTVPLLMELRQQLDLLKADFCGRDLTVIAELEEHNGCL